MPSPVFTPAFFEFLRDLAAHNDRAWFADHKARYVADVETPMLEFIRAVGERLPEISASFVANRRRIGGSMFRIYRDTRFAPDAPPFKTWMAARFRHRGPYEGTPPAFYVHLAPGECFAGGGIYHAEPATVTRIRQRIVDSPDDWRPVRALAADDEDRLKRVPAGYDATHPFAGDLKLKNFYSLTPLTVREACAEDFLDRFMDACRQAAPLVRFLTRALDLPWQAR